MRLTWVAGMGARPAAPPASPCTPGTDLPPAPSLPQEELPGSCRPPCTSWTKPPRGPCRLPSACTLPTGQPSAGWKAALAWLCRRQVCAGAAPWAQHQPRSCAMLIAASDQTAQAMPPPSRLSWILPAHTHPPQRSITQPITGACRGRLLCAWPRTRAEAAACWPAWRVAPACQPDAWRRRRVWRLQPAAPPRNQQGLLPQWQW